MATFFGEILPVTSRAVDDDEEDENITSIHESDPVIHWSKNFCVEVEKLPSNKIPCSVFVIAVGTEANVFSEIYLKPFGYEAVGGVFTSFKDDVPLTSSQSSLTEKNFCIFRCLSKPSVFLCQFKLEVSPEHSYAWTKLLTDSFDLSTADIIVLTSSGMSTYCSELPFSDLEPPFLRCLKTEYFVGNLKCKILEQPNMLTGLPAQLMTFFQAYQYKAAVYVCFKEKRFIDIVDVKTFLPLLQTISIQDITQVNKEADQRLRDMVKLHSVHDMMYM
uniref:Proteasome assembly chaperone 1 n=1 Tax=Arion vulgaris TaxID=1028688 RepID=A0A0B6YAN1_9EUPU